MPLGTICDRISREIDTIVHTLTRDQKKAIESLVRQGVTDASRFAHEEFSQIAREVCGADMDMAHKLQRQMDQKRDMLIANLSAMR